jgi:hypothetical protein
VLSPELNSFLDVEAAPVAVRYVRFSPYSEDRTALHAANTVQAISRQCNVDGVAEASICKQIQLAQPPDIPQAKISGYHYVTQPPGESKSRIAERPSG